MVRLRVRVRFSKQGDLRLLGHRDLMRCFERLFRCAGLALSFSQGFHPKPRMTFPLALAVGIEGLDEVMELELADELSADELLQRVSPQAPAGLRFRAAVALPEGSRKAQVQTASYEAPIPAALETGLGRRIERLLAAASWPVERAQGPRPIDLRPLLLELSLNQGVLRMRLRVDSRGSVGPRDVLRALELGEIEQQGSPAPHRRGGLRMSMPSRCGSRTARLERMRQTRMPALLVRRRTRRYLPNEKART